MLNRSVQFLSMITVSLSLSAAFAAGGPGVGQKVQAFLNELESGDGPPLEQLSPTDARAVLANAQNSVEFAPFETDVSSETIEVDGQEILLKIVRPKGVAEELPVFRY